MNHLNDVKAKLEKTLDQMDGALESKSLEKLVHFILAKQLYFQKQIKYDFSTVTVRNMDV